MNLRIVIVSWLLAFCAADVFSQDPQYSQFYANQLYLNPALAGSAQCPRITLNYRNQWPGIAANYVTYAASYDQYVPGLNGGIGLQVYHDRAGTGIINTNNISGMYAYQLAVDRNFSIKAGFQVSYYQRSINWNELTFPDQIHPRYGFIFETAETRINNNVNKLDFSTGFLAFSDKFYAGFAAHHLTEPDESFFKNTESKLPRKYTAHVGAVLPLNKRVPENGSISPNIIFQRQGEFTHLNLGMYLTKGVITGGVWYRTNDALIFLAGIYTEEFRFGYSYDVTVSSLGTSTLGAHEISIAFLLPCPKRRVKVRQLQCPQF